MQADGLCSGNLPALEDAVVSACREAFQLIDLLQHRGVHPRLGAVDLIPVHPLTEQTSLEECHSLATKVCRRLLTEAPGSSFFLYRFGVEAESLARRRREAGWFSSEIRSGLAPTLGQFNPERGLTGAGASPLMANLNLSLETQDLRLGSRVLANIRQSSGGLPGVSAMCFPHQGGLEVACNVDMFSLDTDNPLHRLHHRAGHLELVMGQFWRTKFEVIQQAVEKTASADGVKLLGDSVIIGFTPSQAVQETLEALKAGRSSLV